MKKILFLLTTLALILTGTILSCKHEPITKPNTGTPVDTTTIKTVVEKGDSSGWKCSPDSVYFQYEVLPILVSACARTGCHDIYRAQGYQFTDYTLTMKKGIVAGKATSSAVYNSIANGSMPPRITQITMTQAQKDIIAKWINQGAKNVNCNPNYGKCDTVGGAKFAAYIQPIVQNKCQNCHSVLSPGSNIKLTNYTEIKACVATGKFWGSINALSGYSAMPKYTRLSACELAKIDSWIKRGVLNN